MFFFYVQVTTVSRKVKLKTCIILNKILKGALSNHNTNRIIPYKIWYPNEIFSILE